MVDTPTSVSATTPRRRLFKHPGRVAIVAVTLLVVLNLGFFLLNESDTSQTSGTNLPAGVVAVTPEPGQIAKRIDTVSAQLDTKYSGVLVIDGLEIPEDQLDRVVSLNTISFRPGPDKAFSSYRAGENQVAVLYWEGRLQDRPAKARYSFGWTFRASA